MNHQKKQPLKKSLLSNNPLTNSNYPIVRNGSGGLMDSSMGYFSTMGSNSAATTPSVPNSNDMSTNNEESDSNEFDSLDTKCLIKLNLSQEQVAQLYESNKRDQNLNSKKTFQFV